MNQFLKTATSDIERRVTQASQKLLRRAALIVLACVMGVVATAFGTASAFLALRAHLTDVQTTVVFAVLFLTLAIAAFAFAQRSPTEPPQVKEQDTQGDIGQTAAFTIAFIVARMLSQRKQGKPDA